MRKLSLIKYLYIPNYVTGKLVLTFTIFSFQTEITFSGIELSKTNDTIK